MKAVGKDAHGKVSHWFNFAYYPAAPRHGLQNLMVDQPFLFLLFINLA